MTFKQRLEAFFFCIDCHGFTLTGWSCRICGCRLCFECAGGYAMYSLYSPGFEMCETCKDKHLESIRANFPIKGGVYGTQKRRCTEQTPLTSSEISRHIFDWLAQNSYDIAFLEEKSVLTSQCRRNIYRYQLTIFDITINLCTSHIVLSHNFPNRGRRFIVYLPKMDFINQSTSRFHKMGYPIFLTNQSILDNVNCLDNTNRGNKAIFFQAFNPFILSWRTSIALKMLFKTPIQVVSNTHIANFASDRMAQSINKVHVLSLRNSGLLAFLVFISINGGSQRINIIPSPDRIMLFFQIGIVISWFNSMLLNTRKEGSTANIQSLHSLLCCHRFFIYPHRCISFQMEALYTLDIQNVKSYNTFNKSSNPNYLEFFKTLYTSRQQLSNGYSR